MHAENPCKVQSSPTALLGLQARTSVLDFPVSSKGCGGGKETGLEWAEKELCDRSTGSSFTRCLAQDQLVAGRESTSRNRAPPCGGTERRAVATIAGNRSPLLPATQVAKLRATLLPGRIEELSFLRRKTLA